MELMFGMRVVDSTGADAGRLDRLLVHTGTREATHVVVRTLEVSEDLLLPLSLLLGAEDGLLRLRLELSALPKMPRYFEGREGTPRERVDTSLASPAATRHLLDEALGIDASTVELGAETPVRSSDGELVCLAGIGVETGAPMIDVVYTLGPVGEQDRIPADWIAEIRADGVMLTVSARDVAEAPGHPRPSQEPKPLEGLSGMGGRGGETPEEKFGEDFTEEMRDRQEAGEPRGRPPRKVA